MLHNLNMKLITLDETMLIAFSKLFSCVQKPLSHTSRSSDKCTHSFILYNYPLIFVVCCCHPDTKCGWLKRADRIFTLHLHFIPIRNVRLHIHAHTDRDREPDRHDEGRDDYGNSQFSDDLFYMHITL